MLAGSRSLVAIAALLQVVEASAVTVTNVQWKAGLIAAGRQSWDCEGAIRVLDDCQGCECVEKHGKHGGKYQSL